MRLSDDDRDYLMHLLAQIDALATALDRRDAFLAYLARKHDLPNGSQVLPDGAIVLPEPTEAPAP